MSPLSFLMRETFNWRLRGTPNILFSGLHVVIGLNYFMISAEIFTLLLGLWLCGLYLLGKTTFDSVGSSCPIYKALMTWSAIGDDLSFFNMCENSLGLSQATYLESAWCYLYSTHHCQGGLDNAKLAISWEESIPFFIHNIRISLRFYFSF